MCKERWRTRDLLLEYDSSIVPFHPRAAGLAMVYPWETILVSDFGQQIYQYAAASGFVGSEQLFKEKFGEFLQSRAIYYARYEEFPQVGEIELLYFDLDDKILYYWDNEYIPVNAMLIANTIVHGGGA